MTESTELQAIWCDDIRQEVGNKPSFMGVYTGGIVVQGLPTVLQRLCIWLTISGAAVKGDSTLGIRIETDAGATLFDIPKSPVPPPPQHSSMQERIQVALALGSVSIPEGTLSLQAVADLDGTILRSKPVPLAVDPAELARSGLPVTKSE